MRLHNMIMRRPAFLDGLSSSTVFRATRSAQQASHDSIAPATGMTANQDGTRGSPRPMREQEEADKDETPAAFRLDEVTLRNRGRGQVRW
jgi:hypothetical protein